MRTAILAALLLVVFAACGGTHATIVAPQATPAPVVPGGDSPPGFRLPSDTYPLAYTIALAVDPSQEGFAGTETIKIRLDTPRQAVWLHGRGLEVTSATIAGKTAVYEQLNDDGLARLALDAPVGPGDVDVEISWQAKYSDSLESVYRVRAEGLWYVFTQFEPTSARDGIPCFDEPGFKAPFTLKFTTRKGDRVVANSPDGTQSVLPDGRVLWAFSETKPLPVYLLAFAVGPLDVIDGRTLPPNDLRREPLPLRGVSIKGRSQQLKKSLDVAAQSLLSLESYFGIAYPYAKMDIVAVPDFAAGAMENAGLVNFRDVLLFVDDQSPIALQKGNLFVIAHEFAHQWFGNFVTLAWWDDIWLNEAFASWMEYRVVDEIRPDFRPTTELRSSLDWVTGEDSLVSARQIRQPVLSKGDIINAFDGITYGKGASVIAMFEAYMGTDAFQRGVRDYMNAHAHGIGTAKELLAAFSKSSGKDISTPFSTFLDQPGVPYVQAKLVCDAAKTSATLELRQSRYLPVGSTGDRNQTWQVPVCARVDGKSTKCTLLTSSSGVLALDSCPKVVHPNADGLGYYRWSLPADQLKTVSSSLESFTPGERISFGNAVRAGFDAATLPFADALDASLPLALDEEPTIAETPLGMLRFAWVDLVEDGARAMVQKKIADTYRPVIDDLKMEPNPKEDPRVRERRTLALTALTESAEDPMTIDALAKLGSLALGLADAGDKQTHLDEVPGDLAALAIAAAVRKGGAALWDDVAGRISTETDSLTRNYLLSALGSVDDAALSAKARELALDPRLKVNEIFYPLGAQADDFRTRDATWAWLPEHYDALMARLPEAFGGDRVPGLFSGYCTEDKAREIESFFAPKKAKTPGMERALAITLESVRLCAARRSAHAESARKVFPR